MIILLYIVAILAIIALLLIGIAALINLLISTQVRKADFLRAINSDKFKDSHDVLEALKHQCSLLSIPHVSIALSKLKQEGLAEEVTYPGDDDEYSLQYYFRITEAGRVYLREHSSS